jgi:hypothetical protein
VHNVASAVHAVGGVHRDAAVCMHHDQALWEALIRAAGRPLGPPGRRAVIVPAHWEVTSMSAVGRVPKPNEPEGVDPDDLLGALVALNRGDRLSGTSCSASRPCGSPRASRPPPSCSGNRLPGRWPRIRSGTVAHREPDLTQSAVNERLRYDSPVQIVSRSGFADVELRGSVVSAGAGVAAYLRAASRGTAPLPRSTPARPGPSRARPAVLRRRLPVLDPIQVAFATLRRQRPGPSG